jgi:hypothetical protein
MTPRLPKQLRNSKVRRGGICHVRSSTGLDDEMRNSCCYGRYHRCTFDLLLLLAPFAEAASKIYGLVVSVLIAGDRTSLSSTLQLALADR